MHNHISYYHYIFQIKENNDFCIPEERINTKLRVKTLVLKISDKQKFIKLRIGAVN